MDSVWIVVWNITREVELVVAQSEESVRIIIEDQRGPKVDPDYSVVQATDSALLSVLTTVWKDQQIFTIN